MNDMVSSLYESKMDLLNVQCHLAAGHWRWSLRDRRLKVMPKESEMTLLLARAWALMRKERSTLAGSF
jgi:hypothetical protein